MKGLEAWPENEPNILQKEQIHLNFFHIWKLFYSLESHWYDRSFDVCKIKNLFHLFTFSVSLNVTNLQILLIGYLLLVSELVG